MGRIAIYHIIRDETLSSSTADLVAGITRLYSVAAAGAACITRKHLNEKEKIVWLVMQNENEARQNTRISSSFVPSR